MAECGLPDVLEAQHRCMSMCDEDMNLRRPHPRRALTIENTAYIVTEPLSKTGWHLQGADARASRVPARPLPGRAHNADAPAFQTNLACIRNFLRTLERCLQHEQEISGSNLNQNLKPQPHWHRNAYITPPSVSSCTHLFVCCTCVAACFTC